jgi:hypothetical protein
MNIFQQHIISRLKQQPKQGGGERRCKMSAEAERLKKKAEDQKDATVTD